MGEAEKASPEGVSQTGEAAGARASGADLFGQSLAVSADELESEPQKFGRGRRPGQRNRSSEDLSRMVQQIAGHPVLAKARVAAMSIKEIKDWLSCTRVQAYDVWDKANTEITSYVASKMPLAVQVSGKVVGLNFTVPLGDGQQLLGPDAVAQLFAVARDRALAEGFELPAAIENGSGDESNT